MDKDREKRGEAREEREVKREERGVSREDREVKREEHAVARDESAIERDEQAARRDTQDIVGHTTLQVVRWRVRILLSIISLFALSAVVFVIVLFLPYAPMKVYSYEIMPREACPLQLLETRIDYSVEPNTPIISAESQAVWTAVDVEGYDKGEQLPGEEAPIAPVFFEPGRREVQGKILRPAPATPGEWRFGVIITLHGNSVTQQQRLTPEAQLTTRVKSGKTCKGAP